MAEMWLRENQPFTFEAKFTTASHMNVSWEIEGSSECFPEAGADPSTGTPFLAHEITLASTGSDLPTWEAAPALGTTYNKLFIQIFTLIHELLCILWLVKHIHSTIFILLFKTSHLVALCKVT